MFLTFLLSETFSRHVSEPVEVSVKGKRGAHGKKILVARVFSLQRQVISIKLKLTG